MHEYSLVRALLGQVERSLEDPCARGVLREVHVEVGPWLCVEPELLQSAFRDLCQSRWPEAELLVEQPLAVAYCSRCHSSVDLPGLSLCCPSCGATEIQLQKGDQFVLTELSFAVPVEEDV